MPIRRGVSRASSSVTAPEELLALEAPGWRLLEAYLARLNDWKLWNTRAHTETLIGKMQADEGHGARLPAQVSRERLKEVKPVDRECLSSRLAS